MTQRILKSVNLDLLDGPIEEISATEARASAMGATATAELLDIIVQLRQRIEALETELDDVETLADWERKHGPADQYREFFYECFGRLGSHYPAPSVTSDYDKSVIFDAIERGVEE